MRTAAKSFRCVLRAVMLVSPLCVPSGVAAQAAATRWEAGAGAGLAVFSSIARRQEGTSATTLLPSHATVTGVSVSWHHQDWEVHTGLETLDAAFAVQDAAVAVLAREATMSRFRWRLLAGRTLARLGEASVQASAGPALDVWTPSGAAARRRVAAVGRMGLRLDAGAVSLENSIAASVSGSPLTEAELPDGYRGKVLRTVEVGLGVRLRF